jgi:transcriptional regulator with GAF, ATPase, and Fis domain
MDQEPTTEVEEDGAGPAEVAPGRLSVEQVQADELDLQTSLSNLAGLVTAAHGLHELLTQVAGFAAQAIPGADGAGVTLLGADRVEALAASAPFVSEIDNIQYEVLNEGPCITAARERRTVRSGSLGRDTLWPRFGPRVDRLGVHSVLSLPLLVTDQVVGAINVYAHDKDVFDEHAAELGELFAAPAAVSVHNAQILAQALTLTAQLQAALTSRPVIDQAIGLLRGRSGGTAEEAFGRLRAISQKENVKVSAVAQRVVDEAVRRARARRAQA